MNVCHLAYHVTQSIRFVMTCRWAVCEILCKGTNRGNYRKTPGRTERREVYDGLFVYSLDTFVVTMQKIKFKVSPTIISGLNAVCECPCDKIIRIFFTTCLWKLTTRIGTLHHPDTHVPQTAAIDLPYFPAHPAAQMIMIITSSQPVRNVNNNKHSDTHHKQCAISDKAFD